MQVLAIAITTMVHSCCIVGCSKRRGRDEGLSFFVIPAIILNQGEKTHELSRKRRDAWLSSISRKDWMPSSNSRVCSEHFISGKPASLYDETNPDWKPSQKMGYSVSHTPDQTRYSRLEQRKRRRTNAVEEGVVEEVEATTEVESLETGVGCQVNVETVSTEVQTTSEFMDSYVKMAAEISSLKKENQRLLDCSFELKTKADVSRLTSEFLKNNEDKLKFYTGIPEWCIFKGLFDLVAPALPEGIKLTKMSMVIMFFLKVRLGLFDEDIADRFGVHPSTVSRNFHRVLDVMATKTAHLIKWPDRETLRLTMPMSFRKFFKQCAIIIDCSEVFIERPSDFLARAQVWSNYKHHSTVKFMIGITPQGTISYVSSCVGGRMSDKEIVENSSLLNYLIPGDIILADRGFTCSEYARMAMAEVKTPPFTKGKKQLEKVDVDFSRELSIVRIHVERVIGILKQKYTILQNILPISLIQDSHDTKSTVDKIVKVCCAFVNLCPSVIPQE